MSFDWATRKTELIDQLENVTKQILNETIEGRTSQWPKLLQERAKLFQAFQECDEHLKLAEHPDAEEWIKGLESIQKLDTQIEDLLDFAKTATQNKLTSSSPLISKFNTELKLPLHFLNTKKNRLN